MDSITTTHISAPWRPRLTPTFTGYVHFLYQRIARILRGLTRTESSWYAFAEHGEIGFPGNLYIKEGFSIHRRRELVLGAGVQRREDARNLTSLRAAPDSCRNRRGPASQILDAQARTIL